jgi:histone RNA hairpin-binding protein
VPPACLAAEAKVSEKEEDAHRIQQRQKQIDFGKNTLGYQRYCENVPR